MAKHKKRIRKTKKSQISKKVQRHTMSSRVQVFCNECLATSFASCLCGVGITCDHCGENFIDHRGSDRSFCNRCYARAGLCMDCELFRVLTDARCTDCQTPSWSPIVPEVLAFGHAREFDDDDYDSDATRLVSDVHTPVRETRYSTPRRTPSPEVMPQPSRRRRRPTSPPSMQDLRRIASHFQIHQPEPVPVRVVKRPRRVVYIDAISECGVCYESSCCQAYKCLVCSNECCDRCFHRIRSHTCPYCRAPDFY